MKSILHTYLINSLVFVLLWGMLGCASQQHQMQFQHKVAQQMAATLVKPDQKEEMPDYLINIGDELNVTFNEREALNAAVKVRPDGRITLHLIGDLMAAGLSTHFLEQQIIKKYNELSPPINNSASRSEKAYLINVNDELDINFPYHAHLNQTVKVRPDGFISLNLINEVVAEHKTPETLDAELNRNYRKLLKNPNLTVVVKQFSSLNYVRDGQLYLSGLENLTPTVIVKSFDPLEIFVAGNVEKPGVLSYRPTLTVIGAIIEAGGQKPGSEMEEVILLRKGANNPIAIKLNMGENSNIENAPLNIHLKPYDIVFIPKSTLNQAGDFIQELGRIIPLLQNSSFSFILDVLKNTTSQNAITTQQ